MAVDPITEVFPLERITWVDSHAEAGWHTVRRAVDDIGQAELHSSVGYIIHETRDIVLLAAHVSHSDDPRVVCDPMNIPKCAIKRRDPITERQAA